MNAPSKPPLLIPDYVIAAIEGYGLARASMEGHYTDAATALAEVFAQLRHWVENLQAPPVEVPDRPTINALSLLKGCRHALRNASTDLGAGLASDIDQYLTRMAEGAPLAEVVALDLLDAAPPRAPSALEVVVEQARDIAEDAEMSVIHRPWRDGAHNPGRRVYGLYQRRYYPGGTIYVCRWDGRIWWSAEASKPGIDPDGWVSGGVSSHQTIEWRGPLTVADVEQLGWKQS